MRQSRLCVVGAGATVQYTLMEINLFQSLDTAALLRLIPGELCGAARATQINGIVDK